MNKLAPVQSAPPAGVVRIEFLAAKLASAQNLENRDLAAQFAGNPKLREMLLFLQWKSMQPGGLPKFVDDLVQHFPQRLGTPTMSAAYGRKYTVIEKIAIWYELPAKDRPEGSVSEPDWSTESLLDNSPSAKEIAELEAEELRAVQKLLNKYDEPYFIDLCKNAATEGLPTFLASLCNDRDKSIAACRGRKCEIASKIPSWFHGDIWYFEDIIGTVLEMMELHAQTVLKTLAQTAVTTKVFDALDYALSEKCSVRIVGDSRFGKSQSIGTWTSMRPGLARLVNVPSSNTLIDLLRKVADAVGVIYTYKTGQNELKAKVEYVIQHCRLFLVCDECAFLIPQTYSKTTAPVRLNWVRTEIIDHGLPFAAVVTPQSFDRAVKRFVNTTDYAMEQFLGRTLLTVPLPSELEEKDLIAVAKIHFPEMDDDHLGLIAAQAMLSENYLMAVEAIAKRARYIAKRENHHAITLNDLDIAISEVMPAAREAQADTSATRARQGSIAPAPKRPFKTSIKGVERPVKLARSGAVETLFSSRSLRSDDSEVTTPQAIAEAS